MRDDTQIERLRMIERAAARVAVNAYGTRPRHTRNRPSRSGCRDDCIPCGLDALTAALGGLDRARTLPTTRET